MEENRTLFGMDFAALAQTPLTLELAQKVVGALQTALYKDRPINSFAPLHSAFCGVRENGEFAITEVRYGDVYPNSFLDFIYPNGDTKFLRPTVVFLHGGGYFSGEKSSGDPLAVGNPDVTILHEIVAHGYNLVNMDYCLMPEGKFPIPLLQLDEALRFCLTHAEQYHLDMTRVILMGGSAGAILTTQYGTLLANAEYQQLLGMHPCIDHAAVKALIVDDAPLMPEHFSWALKVMLGNYCGTVDVTASVFRQYNPYPYFNELMTPCFFDAGTIDGFPQDMRACSEKLTALGVENELYLPNTPQNHGFVSQAAENPVAAECFSQILAFMDCHTGHAASKPSS
jgi:acetyl esterase/lipase